MRDIQIIHSSITRNGGRPVNEDFLDVLIEPEKKAFLLCDGLGGHGNGDVASRLVVGQMKKLLEKDKTLESSILMAQEALLEKQREMDAAGSMKTTMTSLLLMGGQGTIAHVGDSRVYYFEKGKYKLRTHDHSVPQMLADRGEIKEKDIRHHEDRSRLIRVMGTEWNEPKFEVMKPISLTAGSSFLLCSDGFWELIDEKMMCKTLKKAKTPEEWLKSMEQIVLENGKGTNMDNYSAIAVFVR